MQVNYNSGLGMGTVNNPELIELKARIDRLKDDMLVYISNNREAIGDNIGEVNKQIDTTQGNLRALPLKQRGLINITRKLKVNENMYLFLLQRKANTIISRAGILPETKIIERARNMGIVEPDRDKIRYYFLAGAISTVV
jgi:tyrosine-protein kinase Etk/Wzc